MKKVNIGDVPLEAAFNGTVHKKIMVRAEESGSPLAFFQEAYLEPGRKIEPHTHADLVEYFYFLKGRGVMQVGEENQNVAAGDCVTVPVNHIHCIENTSEETVVFIAVGIKAKTP